MWKTHAHFSNTLRNESSFERNCDKSCRAHTHPTGVNYWSSASLAYWQNCTSVFRGTIQRVSLRMQYNTTHYCYKTDISLLNLTVYSWRRQVIWDNTFTSQMLTSGTIDASVIDAMIWGDRRLGVRTYAYGVYAYNCSKPNLSIFW